MKKYVCSSFFGLMALLLLLFSGCGEVSYLDTEEEISALPETEEVEENREAPADAAAYVYVCGEVVSPGVYKVTTQSRVYEVIELAGGLTAEADPYSCNQAEAVYDGMMVRVPVLGEQETMGALEEADGRVNLNTASKEELMTLPGIGESKADTIISYREEHGRFSEPTDLMNIPGIKEGVFGKIKDRVKV